jgi:hypothetical protein
VGVGVLKSQSNRMDLHYGLPVSGQPPPGTASKLDASPFANRRGADMNLL